MKSNKRAGRDLHEQAIYNALYSNKTLVFNKNMLNLTKITKIANKAQRKVTLCKRKRGLIKKAIELSQLCDQQKYLVVNCKSIFNKMNELKQLPFNIKDN